VPNLFSLQKTIRFRLASEGLRRGKQREQRLSSIAGTKQRFPFLCFLWFEEVLTLPRYLAPDFTHYISERLEMIFSQREVTEGQTRKRNMKTRLTKTIMSSLNFTCALGCLVAAIAVGTSTAARAAADAQVCSVCSVDMLRGLYLWTFDGYTRLGGNLLPKAVLQGLQFNGDGTTYNTFGTVNIGGTLTIDATGGVGTYTVAADCTGTLSITGGPTFNMYVGPGGKEIWTTQTNVGSSDGTGLGVGTATRLPGR
jgi:hypothetical protein